MNDIYYSKALKVGILYLLIQDKLMPKVKYRGDEISIYRLGQLSNLPTTTLYRHFHAGIDDGEELVKKAREHLVEYKGKFITRRQLCIRTHSDYRSVNRRLNADVPVEKAISDIVDRRGRAWSTRLTPSNVMAIYTTLFFKEKTQTALAKEYGVHQTTICDIWRHKRWGWLTAPLRFELEENKSMDYLLIDGGKTKR